MSLVVYRYKNRYVYVAGRSGNEVVLEDLNTGEKINVSGETFMSDEVKFYQRINVGGRK